MRLINKMPPSFIQVDIIKGQFVYARSYAKPINQMIAIRQALENCFLHDSNQVQVGCFHWFKKKNQSNSMLNWLRPKQADFFTQACDEIIIQTALSIIYHLGLRKICVKQLCLELTKHPFFQKKEKQYQMNQLSQLSGMLSDCATKHDIISVFVCVFAELGFAVAPLKPRCYQQKKIVKEKRKAKSLSYMDIYIRFRR